MLISKAICKLGQLNYEKNDQKTPGRAPDFGDAHILQMLTGWAPELIRVPRTYVAITLYYDISPPIHDVSKPSYPGYAYPPMVTFVLK